MTLIKSIRSGCWQNSSADRSNKKTWSWTASCIRATFWAEIQPNVGCHSMSTPTTPPPWKRRWKCYLLEMFPKVTSRTSPFSTTVSFSVPLGWLFDIDGELVPCPQSEPCLWWEAPDRTSDSGTERAPTPHFGSNQLNLSVWAKRGYIFFFWVWISVNI